MYLGFAFMNEESDHKIKYHKNAEEMLEHFRERCQKFLTTLETKQKDFSNHSPYAKMSCLHRKITMSFGEPQRPASVVNIAFSVPRIINPKDLDLLQKIDNQQ